MNVGITYNDALNLLLDSSEGKEFIGNRIEIKNEDLKTYERINTMEQLEEIIKEDVVFRINYRYPIDKHFIMLRKSYKENKEKIPTLKKQLPATLKLITNRVDSIYHKTARKTSTSSASTNANSNTEYIEDKNLIVILQKNPNNDFYSAHDKNDLREWLKRKHTLPDNRIELTQAEVNKINNSVGYGEIIKIGQGNITKTKSSLAISYVEALNFISERTWARRSNQNQREYDTEIDNMSRIASHINAGNGEDIINNWLFNISNRDARMIINNRNANRTRTSTASPISRASNNNPGSRRSSARTTPSPVAAASPRLSPRSAARTAAIARANARRDS